MSRSNTTSDMKSDKSGSLETEPSNPVQPLDSAVEKGEQSFSLEPLSSRLKVPVSPVASDTLATRASSPFGDLEGRLQEMTRSMEEQRKAFDAQLVRLREADEERQRQLNQQFEEKQRQMQEQFTIQLDSIRDSFTTAVKEISNLGHHISSMSHKVEEVVVELDGVKDALNDPQELSKRSSFGSVTGSIGGATISMGPLNDSLKEISGLISHLSKENKNERHTFYETIEKLSDTIAAKAESASLVQVNTMPEFPVLGSLKECRVFTTLEVEQFLKQIEKLYAAMEVRVKNLPAATQEQLWDQFYSHGMLKCWHPDQLETLQEVVFTADGVRLGYKKASEVAFYDIITYLRQSVKSTAQQLYSSLDVDQVFNDFVAANKEYAPFRAPVNANLELAFTLFFKRLIRHIQGHLHLGEAAEVLPWLENRPHIAKLFLVNFPKLVKSPKSFRNALEMHIDSPGNVNWSKPQLEVVIQSFCKTIRNFPYWTAEEFNSTRTACYDGKSSRSLNALEEDPGAGSLDIDVVNGTETTHALVEGNVVVGEDYEVFVLATNDTIDDHLEHFEDSDFNNPEDYMAWVESEFDVEDEFLFALYDNFKRRYKPGFKEFRSKFHNNRFNKDRVQRLRSHPHYGHYKDRYFRPRPRFHRDSFGSKPRGIYYSDPQQQQSRSHASPSSRSSPSTAMIPARRDGFQKGPVAGQSNQATGHGHSHNGSYYSSQGQGYGGSQGYGHKPWERKPWSNRS